MKKKNEGGLNIWKNSSRTRREIEEQGQQEELESVELEKEP